MAAGHFGETAVLAGADHETGPERATGDGEGHKSQFSGMIATGDGRADWLDSLSRATPAAARPKNVRGVPASAARPETPSAAIDKERPAGSRVPSGPRSLRPEAAAISCAPTV